MFSALKSFLICSSKSTFSNLKESELLVIRCDTWWYGVHRVPKCPKNLLNFRLQLDDGGTGFMGVWQYPGAILNDVERLEDSSWPAGLACLDLSEPITHLLPSPISSLSPFYHLLSPFYPSNPSIHLIHLIHLFSRSIHLFSWNALVQTSAETKDSASSESWGSCPKLVPSWSQVGPSLRPETHLSARSLGLLWLLLRSPTVSYGLLRSPTITPHQLSIPGAQWVLAYS